MVSLNEFDTHVADLMCVCFDGTSGSHAILSFHSNNMLYPKEDKENRILLYAVSYLLAYLFV